MGQGVDSGGSRARKGFRAEASLSHRHGESVETPMVSQMEDFTSSRAFRVAGPTAFAEAGITHSDVDHLMIYDAFALLMPLIVFLGLVRFHQAMAPVGLGRKAS
jgi:hypothetical protein